MTTQAALPLGAGSLAVEAGGCREADGRARHRQRIRTHLSLVLAGGLTLAACDETGGPLTIGTLVVSTSTGGTDPDPDGYQLTVDGLGSHHLDPTGTAEVDVAPGRHALRLLGVAGHCSVAPEAALEVDVPSGSTTPVAFEVSCPATGARIRTTTTGLDLDPDGYRVEVDGTDLGILPRYGTVLTRLDPGSRTIVLTGLTPNCTVSGSGSQTVILVVAEVAPIEFAVVCTATSGVIGVTISGSGSGVPFEPIVDGATLSPVGPGGLAYYGGVPPGDHVVSLAAPDACSVETDPQEVTVTAGGLIRDTVEVTFSATCPANVRITAPTTGTIPDDKYDVYACTGFYCYYDYDIRFLGKLDPNGVLFRHLPSGTYHIFMFVPPNCVPQRRQSDDEFTVVAGHRLDVVLPVACSP